ncbi:hypothetical protein BH18ACI5_BH18ACI5_27670 [soil metagenome]
MTLEQAIAALTRAGLDVTVGGLRDALWLATQGDLQLERSERPATPSSAAREQPRAAGQTSASPLQPSSSSVPSSPPGGVPSTPQTSLYASGETRDDAANKASPIRVAAGAALPGRLPLLRAMRPFTERWPSRRVEELDEDATAHAAAEQGGRVVPVFRRRPERWFQVEVVVEDAPSMDIWHETRAEFETLLHDTGAFRDVRRWRLSFETPAGATRAEPVLRSPSGARMPPAGLGSRLTRPLILLATHGISPRWADTSMGQVLDTWSRQGSVAILHMLPRSLWSRTVLGEPGALVHTVEPGIRTAQLAVERFAWDFVDDEASTAAIPVIPLEPGACSTWAYMQMAHGRRSPAMLVPIRSGARIQTAEDEEPPGDDQLVALFRSHGSPLAFRLAVYLSPGPFTLPVARLVQAAKFGAQAQQSQLAELFLSGLVRRVTPLDSSAHPDWVQYDIREEARAILLRSLTEEDAHALLDTLQAHVGRYVERTFGKPADFLALVRDEHGSFDLPAWAQPFANIGTAIARMQQPAAISDRPATSSSRETFDVRDEGLSPRAMLERHFGPARVAEMLQSAEDPDGARQTGQDQLFKATVKLMDHEQWAQVAVLSVVRGPVPLSLCTQLVGERTLDLLRSLGAVSIGARQDVEVQSAMRTALLERITAQEATDQHQRIVNTYRAMLGQQDDGYQYRHFLTHAAAADDTAAAEAALFDPTWLGRKVQLPNGGRQLFEELEAFEHVDAIRELREVLKRRGTNWEDPFEWAEALLDDLHRHPDDHDPDTPPRSLLDEGLGNSVDTVGRVFIVYRRDDAHNYAKELHKRLSDRFGDKHAFMDIADIHVGEDLFSAINRSIRSAPAVIVLIGPQWLDVRDANGQRRLEDPRDIVRHEITAALKFGVPVIPVLVGGARMPDPRQLSDELVQLTRLHAIKLSDERWQKDLTQLFDALEPLVGSPAELITSTSSLRQGCSNDVYISYSHIDNQPFGDPRGGWVDIFLEHLQSFVNVHLERRTKVWRDKRLTGAEVFSDEIEQQLRSSAVLLSVISPAYMQSEWCNRELVGFTKAAQDRGSLRVGNLPRVVKVLRLPVERSALPPLLDEVLGTEFYRVDPASGRVWDLLLDPGADARKVFLARVDDVAQDVARLLNAIAASGGAATAAPPASTADTVFLAWTTGDLSEEREKLRRELEARNYRVVPTGAPPLDAAGVRESLLAALREAKIAIHLIGALYGFVPEGEERSMIELQSDEALYQASKSVAARIFWLAPNAQPQDPRLRALVDRLQKQSSQGGRVDLLANQTIEDLKTLVLDRLNPASKAAPGAETGASALVYLMCDQLDRANVAPMQDFLFDQSLQVRLPLFDGDSEQIREEHYETLKECDGVLIFWGKAKEGWVRTMLRDLNKVFGLGRTGPYKAASLYLAGLPDPNKESFRTREVAIIRAGSEFDPDVLRPFVAQLASA